jgi:uncharacterized damage-inducible protein DinB
MIMSNETQLISEIKREFFRRVVEESISRIKKCLSMIDDSQLWYRHNDHVNSIGNLILHLEGNARQWIVSGLGKKPDARKRSEEFVPDRNLSKHQLIMLLEQLEIDMKPIINHQTEESLTEVKKVQVFEETGLSVLIHVIEHFSYHTGQITLITKQLTGQQTFYYGHLNLETNE